MIGRKAAKEKPMTSSCLLNTNYHNHKSCFINQMPLWMSSEWGIKFCNRHMFMDCFLNLNPLISLILRSSSDPLIFRVTREIVANQIWKRRFEYELDKLLSQGQILTAFAANIFFAKFSLPCQWLHMLNSCIIRITSSLTLLMSERVLASAIMSQDNYVTRASNWHSVWWYLLSKLIAVIIGFSDSLSRDHRSLVNALCSLAMFIISHSSIISGYA